jgi:2,3-bisphosphoglycerate-independent phosphoglycerate mutase
LSIVFVFVDGVGLGGDDASNPFWAYPAPFLTRILGAPLTAGLDVHEERLLARGIDAGLGVAGAPQSATGQTALFTGMNAPALLGKHLTAYPNARLRKVIGEHSILKQAVEQGCQAAFANAYSTEYWQMDTVRKGRHSASTLTNLAGNLPFRTLDDLARGNAVYWDITHSTFRLRGRARQPYRSPEEAGQILASLANRYDLVLFETFLTDLVGHRRIPHTDRWVVYALDAFLDALAGALDAQNSLVLCSDHGNFEDCTTRAHTENPVPLIVMGPAASHFAAATRITDVAPAILAALDCGKAATKPGA